MTDIAVTVAVNSIPADLSLPGLVDLFVTDADRITGYLLRVYTGPATFTEITPGEDVTASVRQVAQFLSPLPGAHPDQMIVMRGDGWEHVWTASGIDAIHAYVDVTS